MVGKILVKNQGLRGHFQRFLSKIFKKSKNGKAEKVASTAWPWQPPTLGCFGPLSPFSFFLVCRPPAARAPKSKTWKSEGGVPKISVLRAHPDRLAQPTLDLFRPHPPSSCFSSVSGPRRAVNRDPKVAKVKKGSSIFSVIDKFFCRRPPPPTLIK